ncbi:MAG: hypothetical protein M3017_00145 [Actinomycetota bacterium]|nr:hypothetical protein [Actinomycetota bacterium]
MRMKPQLRRLALTAHITFSVGWIGAVVGFLVLAVEGLISQDSQTVRAVYLAMNVTGWFAVVPLALAALLTGVVSSLGTEWGLLRHYWVWMKFLITIFATAVLIVHMQVTVRVANAAAKTTLTANDLSGDRIQLVTAAGGGLLVLLVVMVLSVYKPRGRTRYGFRKNARKQKQDRKRAVLSP